MLVSQREDPKNMLTILFPPSSVSTAKRPTSVRESGGDAGNAALQLLRH